MTAPHGTSLAAHTAGRSRRPCSTAEETPLWQLPDIEQPDADGSLRLGGLRGRIRITNPVLRSLELSDSPGLESLDLSGCAPGLRLKIEQPTGLKHLQLPQDAPGTIVDFELPPIYRPADRLSVEGALAKVRLEAAWMIHPFHLEPPRGQSLFKGLVLGGAAAGPVEHSISTQLVLGRASGGDTQELDVRGLEQLVLFGSLACRITLDNGRLKSLRALECPRLERVEGDFFAEHATFDVCRRLDTIQGSGTQLSMACSDARRIRVRGRWQAVDLAHADFERIELSSGTKLRLKSLSALCDVQCPEAYELETGGTLNAGDRLAALLDEPPGRLSERMDREGEPFRQGRSLPGHWLRRVSSGADAHDGLPRTMQQLNALAEHGDDREATWRIRCLLNALHRDADIDTEDPAVAFRFGSAAWKWFDGTPLSLDLYLDDLALYFSCRDERVTVPFERTLKRLDRLIHAEVLSAALHDRQPARFDHSACRQWLADCLPRIDGAHELAIMQTALNLPGRWGIAQGAVEHGFIVRLRRLLKKLKKFGDRDLLASLAETILSTGHPEVTIAMGLYLVRDDQGIGRRLLAGGLALAGDIPKGLRADALRELLKSDHSEHHQGERDA